MKKKSSNDSQIKLCQGRINGIKIGIKKIIMIITMTNASKICLKLIMLLELENH
jgi:hypothetical protein